MPFDLKNLLDTVTKVEVRKNQAKKTQFPGASPEEQAFLKDTAMIESSDGDNVDHMPINYGIQKGTAAVGRYGLMPNSIQELIKRAEQNGEANEQLLQLKDKPQEEIVKTFNDNPQLEDEMALRMRRHIMSRPGVQNDEQANYMWQHGHNLNSDKLEERNYEQDPRTIKFKKLRGLIK